ncbi:hypothetical protein Pcinc_031839 [Petrolisthes cinctipes]|uniref:Uncharacterized protein n=1 Tax=Petrolisthes cinctipes TaxID=88211 RepID=A0AAE1K0A0_PETCI|nr:hypothetical protein Pcinc_031839 [Petrolisthes cinctipes]
MSNIIKYALQAQHHCCGSQLIVPAGILRWTAAGTSHIVHNRTTIRTLHTSLQNNSPIRKAKFFYIPNPFMWLHNRMELAALKRDWDPAFDLTSFKYGVIQAVCTVSELASQREWGDLCGLLTRGAINKLRSNKWSFDEEQNLVLSPDNIQMVHISKVSLQNIVDQKYCDIDMIVLGVRAPHNTDKHSLVILEFYARFHREYTKHKLPDWTITTFELKSFQTLPRKEAT